MTFVVLESLYGKVEYKMRAASRSAAEDIVKARTEYWARFDPVNKIPIRGFDIKAAG